MDLHTVISFIDENNGKLPLKAIESHFENTYVDIKDLLRQAEIEGLLYRKNEKNKEMWYS